MTLEEQIIDTWRINNRVNLYLLDAIDEPALGSVLTSKGRSAGEQFAHLHNVRLMWLGASAPDMMEGLAKIEKERSGEKDLLIESLGASTEGIAALLGRGIETGRVKGFKPHVTAFQGYLLAHEAHHRGQIVLALKQSGYKLDKKVAYGIWEWGSR